MMNLSRLRFATAARPLGTLGAWFAWTALATGLNALLAAACYALASLAARDPGWPWLRPRRGLAVATLAAVACTILSERYSVYLAGRWAYAPAMPLVFGIGLAPLAQWTLLPGLTLALLRHYAPTRVTS